MAFKVGQVVGGAPWGYGAKDWQQNIGKFYDPKLPGQYFNTEADLNAAMPKNNIPDATHPWTPTSGGPMPENYNPNAPGGGDIFQQSLNTYNQGGNVDITRHNSDPDPNNPNDQPAGTNQVVLTDNRNTPNSSVETGYTLQDIFNMIDQMEYTKTPYSQNWADLEGNLTASQQAAYDAAKRTMDANKEIQIRDMKDTITGRGIGRSTVAASLLDRPNKDENLALANLSGQQAQDLLREKTAFENKVSQWNTEQDAAANNFLTTKMLMKYQQAVNDRDTRAAAALQIRLAEMGIDANKEIANIQNKPKQKNWYDIISDLIPDIGVNLKM